MKDVTLPSGTVLGIGDIPFAEAKRLYQATMSEFKGVKIDLGDSLDANFIKNMVCVAADSKAIEAALEVCLRRCTYKGVKITQDTFESTDARFDYIDLCTEVIKDTITPFTKSLFAQFRTISQALAKLQG